MWAAASTRRGRSWHRRPSRPGGCPPARVGLSWVAIPCPCRPEPESAHGPTRVSASQPWRHDRRVDGRALGCRRSRSCGLRSPGAARASGEGNPVGFRHRYGGGESPVQPDPAGAGEVRAAIAVRLRPGRSAVRHGRPVRHPSLRRPGASRQAARQLYAGDEDLAASGRAARARAARRRRLPGPFPQGVRHRLFRRGAASLHDERAVAAGDAPADGPIGRAETEGRPAGPRRVDPLAGGPGGCGRRAVGRRDPRPGEQVRGCAPTARWRRWCRSCGGSMPPTRA